MFKKSRLKSKGQATVEFALILGVLLGFIFVIVESARLFQGWLTVQNSARAAGRYALTGSFDTDCLYEFPACLDPRVYYIKDEAKRSAAGISIDESALVGNPGSFSTEVWSTDEDETWLPDYAGRAGDPVRVKVTYDMPIVIPLFWVIADSIPLVGQVTVTNEQYDQISTSRAYATPPDLGEWEDEGPPYADLEITKEALPSTVYSGHPLTYTVTAHNNGPFDAEDIVVVDTLPATTTYIGSSVPGGGYCDSPVGDTLTCYLPNLAGDGSSDSTVSFDIYTLAPSNAPTDPTLVTNVASVSNGPATIDTNLGNNNASVTTEVIPWADLSISKSDNPDPVRISQPLEYVINVLNIELNEAHNVYIEDELPETVTYISGTPAGLCDHDPLTNIVICGPIPLLNPGESVDFTILVQAPPNKGFITNYAKTWADEDDLDLDNNDTTETTNVTPAITDLEIHKESVPYYHYAGESFTYYIDVYNNGPDDAPVAQIEDSIPEGLTILSVSPSCSYVDNDVTCDVGPIAAGVSAQVSIEVSSTISMVVDNDDTQILNTAQVLWGEDQTDPFPGNNEYTALNYVSPWVDLSIEKIATPQVYDGDLVTYTLTVYNDGPFIAEDVEIDDWFPYPEGDTDGRYGSPECSVINNSYAHCYLGDLAVDATKVVTVVAVADWPGDSWNEAEVYAEEDDPYNPENNYDEALTVILPRTELRVIKHAPNIVYRDYPFYYGLEIWNDGPSEAYGVKITDTLPITATYEYVSPSTLCSYVAADHQVKCTMDFTIGQRRWVWIRVRPQIEGSIVNRVDIGSDDYDSNLLNNMDVVTSTVAPSADLIVSKSGPEYVFIPGDTIRYTVVVTNNGPSTVTYVTVVDTLPSGLTMNVLPAGCSQSGSLISCTIPGPFGPGQQATFSFLGTPTTTGYKTNQVSVDAPEHDPNTSNDTDSITTFVDADVDLSLDKTGPPATYTGQVMTYTLTATNNSTYWAHGVEVVDTLPLTTTFYSASPGCSFDGGNTVTCYLNSIGPSASKSVDIRVIAHEEGAILNQAVVDGLETDTNPANDTDSWKTVVDPAADLLMTKSAPEYVSVFDQFTYELEVTNNGPYTATNVVVTDTLPAAVMFESASAECAPSGATVTCTVAQIPPQTSAVFSISVTPQEYGQIINEASTGATEWDPDVSNNSDTAVTLITQADLRIRKDAAEPAYLDEELVYSLEVENDGPTVAHSIIVIDYLPAEVSYVSNDAGCVYDAGDHTVTCTIDELADDSSVTIHITVVPNSTGEIENTAEVAAYEMDPDLSDNTDSESSTVLPSADIELVKSAAVSITVGATFEYQLSVTNNGPSDATDITVVDTLPEEVSYLDDSQGCAQAGQVITCTIPALAVDESTDIFIQVEALQYGTATNVADADGAEFDPAPENNSDSASTTVTEADLSINKTGPTSVTVFEEFSFSITVSNNGPSNAEGVVVADALPAGMEYLSSDPPCSPPVGQLISCSVGTLHAGENAVITINARATQPGTMVNEAEVSSDTHDPDLGNNQDSASVVVTQADLWIVKSNSSARMGVPFTYTIEVFNDGPSTAVGVEVTDRLPAEVSFNSADAGCTYNAGDHTVYCSGLPPVPAGGSTTVDIVVTAGVRELITNEAEVSGTRYDPDLSNNTTSLDTIVGPSVDLRMSVSGPAQVLKDTWFTVTLTVSNNGPGNAAGVAVTNTIQIVHGADALRTYYPGCTVINAGRVVCSISSINAGSQAVIKIGVLRKSKAIYTNQAWVDNIYYDPNMNNNMSSIVIDVR